MTPPPLILFHQDFDYARMKALTWVANDGLSPNMVQHDAGEALASVLRAPRGSKPFVVNLQGILEVSEYAMNDVKKVIEDKKSPLVLLNGDRLQTRLDAELGSPDAFYKNVDCRVYGGNQIDAKTAESIVRDAVALEENTVRRIVKDCYRRFPKPQRLHSTPLLASGVFDARTIISDRVQFIWTVLVMAERLERALEHFESQIPPDKVPLVVPSRILAVSLRASPLAAALSMISSRELSVEIVDHMGPKHAILEEHSFANASRGIHYVYVGDFLIGGTELKTAQMYAISKGCRVGCAVILGHWLPITDYEENMGTRLTSLVDLSSCRDDTTVQWM